MAGIGVLAGLSLVPPMFSTQDFSGLFITSP